MIEKASKNPKKTFRRIFNKKYQVFIKTFGLLVASREELISDGHNEVSLLIYLEECLQTLNRVHDNCGNFGAEKRLEMNSLARSLNIPIIMSQQASQAYNTFYQWYHLPRALHPNRMGLLEQLLESFASELRRLSLGLIGCADEELVGFISINNLGRLAAFSFPDALRKFCSSAHEHLSLQKAVLLKPIILSLINQISILCDIVTTDGRRSLRVNVAYLAEFLALRSWIMTNNVDPYEIEYFLQFNNNSD